MDPITLAIMGGMGVFSGALNFFGGRSSAAADAKRQFEYQQQLMDKQFGMQQQLQDDAQNFSNQQMQAQQLFALDMWNKNNQYNSQSAIDDRLRAAGRNPYLTGASSVGATQASAGGFSSAGMGSAPSGSAAGIQTPYTPLSAIMQSMANMGVQSAQIQGILEDVKSKKVENKYKEMDTILKFRKMMSETDNTELRNYYQRVQNMFIKDMQEQDYITKLETNKNLKLQGQSMGYTIAAQALQNSYLPDQLKTDIALKNAQLFSEYQRGKLTTAQYKHELIKSLVTKEQSKSAKVDTYQKTLDYSTASEIAGYLVRKAIAEAETFENNKYPRDWWQESFQKSHGSVFRGFGYGSEVLSPFKLK